MWEALKYVGSGFTLVAFIAAVISVMYRAQMSREERLIKTAPEVKRAALVSEALEFFSIDTRKLTQTQQYEVALEQIKARGRRFQIAAIVVVIVAFIAAGLTAYTIYKGSAKETSTTGAPSLRFTSTRDERPVGEAVAEPTGSSVQLFEHGWMLAHFSDQTLLAIAISDDGTLKWWKRRDSAFVKGVAVTGDGKSGDRLLILGFRWYYFDPASAAIRKALGRPITAESRAWVQFQRWNVGEVAYGLPSTADDYRDGFFQVLAGVMLLKEPTDNTGTGELSKITVGSVDGQLEYCSVNWYAANKDRSLPRRLTQMIDHGQCISPHGVDAFTAPHSQILLK